jgi:hypothetical protein
VRERERERGTEIYDKSNKLIFEEREREMEGLGLK